MRFKTKDLMVSVSPNVEIDDAVIAQHCLWRTRICVRPTIHPCHCSWISPCGCSFVPSVHCGFLTCGGSACDPTIIPCPGSFFEIEDPADLVTLRKELKEVLQRVDEFEEKGLPTQLRTKSDLDAAEEALKGALEEVQRQRRNAE